MKTLPPNYYDNINRELLSVVDPCATRIAEFGCGAGGLARAIRAKCTAPVHYVGIELVAEQLTKAGAAIDHALVRNLDKVPDWLADADMASALPLESFDHVIFGDVLEHLYSPEKVLQQAVARLRPGGSVLACIPNVQHWGVLSQLIRGHWPQLDSGLFDRTHIRWFALRDMLKLLRVAGLTVDKVIPRVFNTQDAQPLLDSLEPAVRLLGMDVQQFRTLSLPLQYVLVGRK
jgi:SAM-dependent methyltransferase